MNVFSSSFREPQDHPECQDHQDKQGNRENQDFLYVYALVTVFCNILYTDL